MSDYHEDTVLMHQQYEEDKTVMRIPPSKAELQEYLDESKAGFTADEFMDYYAARGWYLGKTKMKDWRAAVRTWKRNRINRPKTKSVMEYLDDE